MKVILKLFLCALILSILVSCGTLAPEKMELPMTETAPQEKVTRFSETLKEFGLMLEIYRSQPVKVMIKEVVDKTGASVSTGSEIQQNITEIVKSTLNTMGENVVYMDYDPEFVATMQQTGYSNFGNKLIPDVVVTGAITEFDRALQTVEKGMDLGAEVDIAHVGKVLPSQTLSFEYGDSSAANKARITVDFNLKKFQTLASVPGMNVINTMEVQKAVAKQEFGITLFGPTFGTKGSLKRVQGRHDAIRLLVQSGMVQLMGRYAGVPYWRLMGQDAVPDETVLKSWRREFPKLSESDRVSLMQQYLYLHGYDVSVNGIVDEKTKAAFSAFRVKNNIEGGALNAEVFLKIYLTVPITEETFSRAQAPHAASGASQASQQQQPPPTEKTIRETQSAPADAPSPSPANMHGFASVGNVMTTAYNYFKRGDYPAAAWLFDESIKVIPTPVAYYFLALCYQNMKDTPRAIASLEEGVRQFRNDFPLWKALGMIYSEAGDTQRAKHAFSTAAAIRPDNRQVQFFLQRLQ